MKQKVVKITIIFLLLQPILLMVLFATGTTIDRNMYTKEYKDFYIHKFDYEELSIGFKFNFGTGSYTPKYTKIWFLPFQKEKLLNKIKEDVNEILTEIQVTNENVTVDYEISDDFKEVMIYIDNIITYRAYCDMYEIELREEIGMRVALYHDILQNSNAVDYGHVNVPYYGNVVHFIYTGSES